MIPSILLTVFAQLFFSIGDVLKRFSSAGKAFNVELLKDPQYLLGVAVFPVVGYVILLYVLTRLELSRAIPVLGMSAIVFSVVLGTVFLKEHLTTWNVLGVALAVVAIYLVQLR